MGSSIPPYTYLYRVLRTDEVVIKGLTAKNPSAQISVQDFVEKGSQGWCQSQYISTSAVKKSAETWAKKGYDYIPNGKLIAEINTSLIPNQAVIYFNLTNPLIMQSLIPNSDAAQNFAMAYNEVLIVGTIPANAIVNVFKV